MTKLIKLLKPEKIDDIIRSGVVLKSRKAYNVLFDYINSVEFFVGLYGDKPIEIMKNDLNILERNNKIFKFKPY